MVHLLAYLLTYFHSWLVAYKTGNISETVEDKAIVTSNGLNPIHTVDADETKRRRDKTVASSVWTTHPSAVVTQFTISCADNWQVTT